MTKEEIKQMIIARIKTEYKKYHNTPVDFIESAAIKIVLTLEEDSKQGQLLPIDFVSKSCFNCNGWGYTLLPNGRRDKTCEVCK